MPEASDAAREEGRCFSHRSAPDSERSHFTLIRGVFTCQGMMSYLLTLTPHTATLGIQVRLHLLGNPIPWKR